SPPIYWQASKVAWKAKNFSLAKVKPAPYG
ncbi:MAG: hypothetical protein SLRJCFUN_000121, partial [Candidatus Fervidibacter sp.]